MRDDKDVVRSVPPSRAHGARSCGRKASSSRPMSSFYFGWMRNSSLSTRMAMRHMRVPAQLVREPPSQTSNWHFASTATIASELDQPSAPGEVGEKGMRPTHLA